MSRAPLTQREALRRYFESMDPSGPARTPAERLECFADALLALRMTDAASRMYGALEAMREAEAAAKRAETLAEDAFRVLPPNWIARMVLGIEDADATKGSDA